MLWGCPAALGQTLVTQASSCIWINALRKGTKASQVNTPQIGQTAFLETNWQCGNHAKIGSVTSDAELRGDTEHRPIP